MSNQLPAAGLRTVFVLSGVPPGGSGGSHSIAQECAGLRVLGVDARIAVPTQWRERTEALYGDLVPIDGNRGLTAKSARADVLVATDFRSVALLRALADGTRTGHAYYVQDYEPFFHAAGWEPADAALPLIPRAERSGAVRQDAVARRRPGRAPRSSSIGGVSEHRSLGVLSACRGLGRPTLAGVGDGARHDSSAPQARRSRCCTGCTPGIRMRSRWLRSAHRRRISAP